MWEWLSPFTYSACPSEKFQIVYHLDLAHFLRDLFGVLQFLKNFMALVNGNFCCIHLVIASVGESY